VLAGIKEVKAVIGRGGAQPGLGRRTLVFNRRNPPLQQGPAGRLPALRRARRHHAHRATTENPSFEIISALLSRSKVYNLRALTVAELTTLVRRAIEDHEHGLGDLGIQASDELLEQIALFSNGDARSAYNTLEAAIAASGARCWRSRRSEDAIQRKVLLYDKSGEEHYNIVSALHKSVRSSDVDASL